jgi:hypothetical protein
MQFLHSPILERDQKVILKEALLLYIADLQKNYYKDKLIDESSYLNKMQELETIIETLHLTEFYQ